ncbi:uncharacterized protein O3C94_005980 [Discoglossus pictus]
MQPEEMHLTFQDVAVYFSLEEWQYLETWQKEIYKEVMMDNYENLNSVGVQIPKPDILLKIEQGKDPWEQDVEENDNEEEELLTDYASVIEKQIESELEPLHIQTEVQTCDVTTESKSSKRPPYCVKCGDQRDCHCKTRSKKKPYCCVDCGKSYNKEFYVVLHQKSHLRGEPYKCSSCEKSFRKPSHLRRHEKTHKVLQHKCKTCDECFVSNAELLRHKKLHKVEKYYKCMKCEEIFMSDIEVKQHQKIHKRFYHCLHCEKMFSNKNNFIAHHKEHLGKIVYVCEKCRKVYARKANFDKHICISTQQMATPNDSQISRKETVQEKQNLLYSKSLQIVENQKVFAKQEVQNQIHLSGHCEYSNGFREDIINASHLVSNQTAQNIEMIYPAEKTIVYNSTNPPASQIEDLLEKEKVLVNNKERLMVISKSKLGLKDKKVENNFECTKCRKCYRHRKSYMRHKKTHTTVFVCHECGQKFRKLSDLFMHRPAHGRNKLYKCRDCEKGFSFKSLLALHQNTHCFKEPDQSFVYGNEPCQPLNLCLKAPVAENPYKCSICELRFKEPSFLLIHQKTHKNISVIDKNTVLKHQPSSQIPNFKVKRPLEEFYRCNEYVKRISYRS